MAQSILVLEETKHRVDYKSMPILYSLGQHLQKQLTNTVQLKKEQ